MSEVRHIEERYEVTVVLTPEEYDRLSNDALWQGGGSVASYLKDHALGRIKRGC
jgi:hypothetical protein